MGKLTLVALGLVCLSSPVALAQTTGTGTAAGSSSGGVGGSAAGVGTSSAGVSSSGIGVAGSPSTGPGSLGTGTPGTTANGVPGATKELYDPLNPLDPQTNY